MIVVAVYHLLDVVTIVVVDVVADVLPVVDPIAGGGAGAGIGTAACRFPPIPDAPRATLGNYAAVGAVGPQPVSHVATEAQGAALKPVTPVAIPRRTDQALSQAMQWRTPVVGLTQGARRPG